MSLIGIPGQRRRRLVRLVPNVLAVASLAVVLSAEEGKWTPQQVVQLDPAWLSQQGLSIPVSQLWNPDKATGLLTAAVSIPGCSAALVSSTGLLLTNHHCLFGLIQEHSRPDRDLITTGFLARSQADELPGKTMRVIVPRGFTDVTQDIERAVPSAADDSSRSKAIEARQKALVAECERTPGLRCSVAAFDGGLQYVLVKGLELTDVRLVYSPPRVVGEFGGEIENFRWPRHVGDFAVARVYHEGKPYRPDTHIPIAAGGVAPGDFVMVMGYPGRSFRSLTAEEMANERRFRFELAERIFGDWIARLQATSEGSAEGRIAVAALLKSLENTHTNAQGQLQGLTRGRLIERQRAADDAVAAWAATRPDMVGALAAKRELDRIADARRQLGTRDYLLALVPAGSLALRHAAILVRQATEREKPDIERDPVYMDRERARLRASIERDQKSFYQPADEALLVSWVEHALALSPKERLAVVDARFSPAPGEVKAKVSRLYGATKVTDLAERLAMFEETTAQLRARRDAMLDLAFALDPVLKEWRAATDLRDGAVARLRPQWRRAVIAHAGTPIAPDANSTLRVSFAHVKGYAPRDGVFFTPQTVLGGMMDKYTGEEPFDLPDFFREAASRDGAARVPVDFLADADTTGGNSGSPVVNGKGELVGLNFDRVWENVANDFGYTPEVSRNISVDIRFVVWMLRVQGANELLRELGLPQ